MASTQIKQSTFHFDVQERKSRGSRQPKYCSSDKDHDGDEKDAAAAVDLSGDDDDNNDDYCNDNYDDESEEEEGSERQPKDTDVSNEKGKSSSAASTKPKSKSFKERLFGKRKKLKVDPDHQKLLDRIEDLQSEKAAAQSKIRQLQFQMSNDAEEVSKAQEERDELKAEVSKLQLQVEGLKAQLDKAESDLEDFKDLRNTSSVLGMISLHGFLWKRGVSGLTGRTWRHRYFKLENDSKIYYYWRAGRIWWSKGFMDISNITEVQDVPDSDEEKFCFNVVTPDRTYEIKAKDNDGKLSWIKGIRGLIYWTNHREEAVNQIFNR